MPENKVKENNRIIKSDREILSGTLEDNNAYSLTIGIPGRGKIKIKISFEKESPRLSLNKGSNHNVLV